MIKKTNKQNTGHPAPKLLTNVTKYTFEKIILQGCSTGTHDEEWKCFWQKTFTFCKFRGLFEWHLSEPITCSPLQPLTTYVTKVLLCPTPIQDVWLQLLLSFSTIWWHQEKRCSQHNQISRLSPSVLHSHDKSFITWAAWNVFWD